MKGKKLAEKPNSPAKIFATAIPSIDNAPIVGRDGKQYTLTLRQQLFCEKYLEFRGNGVQAIFESGYKVKNARVAAAIASENLTKPNIIAYVNSQLEKYGFNDDNVTREHLFLINQYSDLQAKNKAVDMYYKLKGTYAPEKTVTVAFTPDSNTVKVADEYEKKLKEVL